MDKVTFTAIIEQNSNIDAAFVRFPFDTQKLFGIKGQVKVKVLFDDKVEYRGSLANMGHGCHILGLTKEVRKKISKSFGDTVNVELTQDTAERIVIIPSDVEKLLNSNKEAKEFFNALSYTNRKEYIGWIESAKKEETRANRLILFIEKLNNRKKFSDK